MLEMSYFESLPYDLKIELKFYIAFNEINIHAMEMRYCCYPCGADGIIKVKSHQLNFRFLPYRLARFLRFIRDNPKHTSININLSENYDKLDNFYYCNNYVLSYSNMTMDVLIFKYIKKSIPKTCDYKKLKTCVFLSKEETQIFLRKLWNLFADLEIRNVKQCY